MVVHGRIAVGPRDGEQATDTVSDRPGRPDAREITGSIDLGVAVHDVAKPTSIVGARLDESGIRPSSSGYARAVIGYARYRACDARKNLRKYRVGALGAGDINYARCRNAGVAAGLDSQCALVRAIG